MADKIIKIPSSVTIDDGRTLSFHDFVRDRLNDTKWGANIEFLEARSVVLASLIKAEVGQEWRVRVSPDWEVLQQVTRSPSAPYNPVVAGQLLTFLRAVIDAKTAVD